MLKDDLIKNSIEFDLNNDSFIKYEYKELIAYLKQSKLTLFKCLNCNLFIYFKLNNDNSKIYLNLNNCLIVSIICVGFFFYFFLVL